MMSKSSLRNIMLMLMTVVACACHNDEPEVVSAPLYPILGVEHGTRASFTPEDGYNTVFYPFNELYPTPINKDYSTIGVFLVQEDKNSCDGITGKFTHKQGNEWNTTVTVKKQNYFIYGVMPASIGAMEPKLTKREDSTSWADGALITLKNLSAVTPADICVIVGVKKGENRTDGIDAVGIKQGEFGYEGTEKDNFVYILLDHLYANVNFELYVDAEYAALRTFELTGVRMESSVNSTIDLDVEIISGNEGSVIASITPQLTGTLPPSSAELFPAGGVTKLVVSSDPAKPTSIPGYFAPGKSGQEFTFTFTYNVYDKKGNLVRSKCSAQNKWSLPGTSVSHGKSFKILARLKPTYLYQLSEPDLDNPTLEIVNP